jgi:hypothetical protein
MTTDSEMKLILLECFVGARYNFLCMGWSLSRRLKVSDSPPEEVRRRFLEQVFDENLAKASGPDYEFLTKLRQEAMAPGSKWLRPRLTRPSGRARP